MKDVMDRVLKKISEMSADEFAAAMEASKNSPIAIAMRELQEFSDFLFEEAEKTDAADIQSDTLKTENTKCE